MLTILRNYFCIHILSYIDSKFNSDEKFKQAIIESRWSDGDVVCPYCGGHHCLIRKDGKFRCKHCGKDLVA
ncbi:MAG: transposase [Prevotella sp.]|nr:transposase [Prevotella sp.]